MATFYTLPIEQLLHNIDYKSLKTCSLVCKSWHNALKKRLDDLSVSKRNCYKFEGSCLQTFLYGTHTWERLEATWIYEDSPKKLGLLKEKYIDIVLKKLQALCTWSDVVRYWQENHNRTHVKDSKEFHFDEICFNKRPSLIVYRLLDSTSDSVRVDILIRCVCGICQDTRTISRKVWTGCFKKGVKINV